MASPCSGGKLELSPLGSRAMTCGGKVLVLLKTSMAFSKGTAPSSSAASGNLGMPTLAKCQTLAVSELSAFQKQPQGCEVQSNNMDHLPCEIITPPAIGEAFQQAKRHSHIPKSIAGEPASAFSARIIRRPEGPRP